MHRNLALRTLPDDPFTPKHRHVVEILPASVRRRLRQHQRRSGRGIFLVAVMHLHDFAVVLHAQDLRGLPDEPQQKVDAEREVAALHHGNLLRRRVHRRLLLVGQTRRAQDVHHAVLGGLRDILRHGLMEREVDHGLRLRRPGAGILLAHVALRDQLQFLRPVHEVAEHVPHAPRRAQNRNFHFSTPSSLRVSAIFARFAAVVSQSGRRYTRSSLPMRAKASFTITGLVSMKRSWKRL